MAASGATVGIFRTRTPGRVILRGRLEYAGEEINVFLSRTRCSGNFSPRRSTAGQ